MPVFKVSVKTSCSKSIRGHIRSIHVRFTFFVFIIAFYLFFVNSKEKGTAGLFSGKSEATLLSCALGVAHDTVPFELPLLFFE